ncbi:hypothetical protein PDN90_29835, partial [Escherichia coli]|nr:hypothetical protein [Escherichia coli]
LAFQNHTNCLLTDFGGKTSIFSHPVYIFLRKFSLQDFRGGSNSVIRHAIKKRKVFPTDDSVKKVVWLAIQSASRKWTMPLKDWRMAMSRFIIEFGDRLDGHF